MVLIHVTAMVIRFPAIDFFGIGCFAVVTPSGDGDCVGIALFLVVSFRDERLRVCGQFRNRGILIVPTFVDDIVN
ncbi:hypothetical protein N7466_003999 [Penicillium verhagenii]|uniref:uncharacterized protein n=1 Tax=Penicillium verhagenii TaxID=1562060 RepID=UPI002545B3F7|nr:uncharacterized protein N7466_003999 [Penicillium verhagenii]KAJ5934452.1 hypothetical protein N7466_003999 [Penicillium verhagenii]